MSNRHLIAYGSELTVCGLLHFSVTETREVLLNDLSVFKGFFEFFAVGGDTRSCIGDIVRQGFLDQADSFFGNQGMCSVSPEEDQV